MDAELVMAHCNFFSGNDFTGTFQVFKEIAKNGNEREIAKKDSI
jgi:hypothetical protein